MRDSSNDDGLNATIHPDGCAVLVVDETPHAISTTSAEDARREIVRLTAQIARQLDAPIRVIVTEPDGTWPLVVDGNENVEFVATNGTPSSYASAPAVPAPAAAASASAPAPASADAPPASRPAA